MLEANVSGPWEAVPWAHPGAAAAPVPLSQAPAPGTVLQVLVTLQYAHPQELQWFLTQLSDPGSPDYHHYLTATEFDREFSPSNSTYAGLVRFVEGEGGIGVQTFSDRATLVFNASISNLSTMFHTNFLDYRRGSTTFVAPSRSPALPASLAGAVVGVTGLDTDPLLMGHVDSHFAPVSVSEGAGASHPSLSSSGYILPPTIKGVQYEYAPDFQVAYDEQSLFQQSGYPRGAVVATILWAGENSSGTAVGPFVPGDVYDFYNETLPAGEPHAHLVGVPINGAAPPGNSASFDTTGAYFENTLDLEMVGSTAPGATIYNVYGPNSSLTNLDEAFATILSPPAGDSGLKNVSAISNSWGGTGTYTDTNWYSDLEQAQARGITVLASSGDSGDNPASSKYVGSTVEIPSSQAYNTFGDVAVGGTTVTLTNGLTLDTQVAWNISSSDTRNGGPAGSTGGISSIFPEPSWQTNSSANQWISGAGRGVPDLSAIANNTLVTISINGVLYRATNASSSGRPFYSAWGTSIASPLTAGLIAEIDHVLGAAAEGNLGFLDPGLYPLADQEFAALSSGANTGYNLTGPYNSSLPTLPLSPVTEGRNFLYTTHYGYSLVTGWGSLDAYNYTMYFLTAQSSGVLGRLSGVQDVLSLAGLNVTSTFSTGGVNTQFNASIQQNFFLANSLGAPVYWVQNVIYITNVTGGWDMSYSGWVIFPFYGLYPSDTVYEYNYPPAILVHLPHTFVVSSNLTLSPTPAVDFSVNSHTVSLPVPGAAYIIGDLWYNYSWEGTNYSNGPYPGNPDPGGLSPQFGLVGGPSLGVGNFVPPTQGSLVPRMRAFGQTSFIPAASRVFQENVDETGEAASNLTWQPAAGNSWSVGYQNGATDQGVLSYASPARFPVNFQETGLPTGDRWFVNVSGVGSFNSTTSTLSFSLSNGSYSYTVSSGGNYYAPTPGAGSLDESGSVLTVSVTFQPYSSPVTFHEGGLPAGQRWEVTLGTQTLSGTSSTLSFTVLNGSYSFQVGPSKGWLPSPSSGTVSVTGSAIGVTLTFSAPQFAVTFLLTSGSPTSWNVSLSNGLQLNTTAPSLTAGLPNGTYRYAVSTPDTLWKPQPAFGSVTVAGLPQTVNVTFVAATYAAQVLASGLPASVVWWANLSGQAPARVQGNSTSFSLTNGSYLLRLSSTNPLYRPTPSAVGFTVQGSALTVNVAFERVTYLVSILGSSAPGPSSWNLTIAGVGSWSTPTSGVFLDLSNGSYAFTVTSGDPTWRPVNASGTLLVDGAAVNRTVAFTRVVYPVSFEAVAGVGPGSWGVSVNGGPSQSETNGKVQMSLPNGTYAYQVLSGNATWRGTPTNADLTVQGGSLSVPVRFALVKFDVIFQAVDLPGGRAWQVDLTGVGNLSGTSGSLNVSLENGSYDFQVLAPAGMTATPAFGYVSVQGQSVNESIALASEVSPSHSSPPFSLSGDLLYLGLAILAVGIVAILIAVLASRRRRQSPPPGPG